MKAIIEKLEAIASEYRGSKVTISVVDGVFTATGRYSYFPQNTSVGTATTVDNSILVKVSLINNLFLAGPTGTLELAGLSGYDYDIQNILGRDMPDCMLKIAS